MVSLLVLACDPDAEPPASRALDPPARVQPAAEPRYVGGARCAACHALAAERWRGSHHDRAMQEANQATVLGDFADARFEHSGVASTFSHRDGLFFVNTEGPDGRLADFEIAYTFGVEPLQQYLVRFPGGRLQALGVAWDSRPREAGGQRWFHLYPDERIPPGDVLHWTQPSQNWNARCAECHSTNLRKGFDLARGAYDTTWSELDVACEACHGPGSRHAAWAEAMARGESAAGSAGDFGLAVRLGDAEPARWVFDAGAPIARRDRPRASHTELETCAPCHARRSTLREGRRPGEPFLDTQRPSLLDEGLYEPDGQMRDEVYVWGSFVQSRMHAAGVSCGDCHDPHSLALRAEGNALCARCHRPEVFDAPAHHRHATGSSGARCVACHMPARTYMVIDVRHDHSFRVPRPDLSVTIGTPNACTDCHSDRPAGFAADALARWFPEGRAGSTHFGVALDAGQRGLPGAERALLGVADDRSQPAIVRATALALLASQGGPGSADAVRRGLTDPDPLVRLGALEAAEGFEPAARLAAARPLLRDPLRALRIEAARLLADVPPNLWRPEERSAHAAALAEYRAAQDVDSDRPEAHVNLGLLHVALGEPDAARREYETALRLGPWFVPAYVNLADLERALGRDDAGEAALRRALAVAPEVAEVHHALGLLLVRTERRDEAAGELARAAELAPENPRFAYARALLLHDRGEGERALAVLEAALARHPGERELRLSAAAIARDLGHTDTAVHHARAVVEAWPDDPEARGLLDELERVAP